MDENILALAEHPDAFGKCFTVQESDIDGFGHVNNAIYLKWLDATVWEHTRSVGLSEHACIELNRGMAVAQHRLDYLASAYLGDEIAVFNWVCANDGRLRATRVFQIVRISDQKTLLRAQSDYICVNLTSGRPSKMPEIFQQAYPVTRVLSE